MSRNYERLEIEEFGRHLITTGDLDPVYIALPKAIPDVKQMQRWLIAYWCLYHCGTASYLSEFEGREFWHSLVEAAKNDKPAPTGGRWTRGSERRHWRGKQAIDSALSLMERHFKPEDMVDYIMHSTPDTSLRTPYTEIAERTKEHRAFGPWISFKVADMAERILKVPVDFSEAEIFMFKDPVKAALMLWRKRHNLPDNAEPKNQAEVIHKVVVHLTETFSDLTAPPLGDRPVGLQEVETCLCKWKSHMNGHYPLFNDIDEINEGLSEWAGVSKTAQEMLKAMPKRSE
ncbi:MAG: hypothetical protein KAJ19_03875 [Gammaproteobacteria bacterium]|nr:hypothetical protein [Gammaproteobacteria bacterium]